MGVFSSGSSYQSRGGWEKEAAGGTKAVKHWKGPFHAYQYSDVSDGDTLVLWYMQWFWI